MSKLPPEFEQGRKEPGSDEPVGSPYPQGGGNQSKDHSGTLLLIGGVVLLVIVFGFVFG